MPKMATKRQDEATRRIFEALRGSFSDLPEDAEEVVYRYNPVSIRVRVVSKGFQAKKDERRELMVLKALKGLPQREIDDISMLLTLTPEEAERPDLLSLEFDDPGRSLL